MDDVFKAIDEARGHVQELHSGQKMTTRVLSRMAKDIEALRARSAASEMTIRNLSGSIEGMKVAIAKAFDRLDGHAARIKALEDKAS